MYRVKNNINAESFLKTNKAYNPAVVGEYSLNFDKRLACLCYMVIYIVFLYFLLTKISFVQIGESDDKVLELTKKFQYFDLLSDYCLSRNSQDLWYKTFNECLTSIEASSEAIKDEPQLIDGCEIFLDLNNPFFSALLKSTIDCQDLNSLKILIGTVSEFSNKAYLFYILKSLIVDSQSSLISSNDEFQTLFLKLAAKYESKSLMNYLRKLKHYRSESLYEIFKGAHLFEETFEMLRIQQKYFLAMKVLIEDLKVLLFVLN